MNNQIILASVKKYKTPLYIYDGGRIINTCKRLRSLLIKEVKILYSIKANPNIKLCNIINTMGLGAEIASGGELSIALKAGFLPMEIVAAGPGKSKDELEYYIESGISLINCESISELKKINAIGKITRNKIKITLRINPQNIGEGAKVKMGGKPSQFGVDEEKVEDVLKIVDACEFLELVGIHVYCGTQILKAETIVNNCNYIANIALKVFHLTGYPVEIVDFGGGLGVPYFENEVELDIESVCTGINKICSELNNSKGFEKTKFILEIGRFIVGNAGYYVCQIQDIKVSRDITYVILDGGINHYLSGSPLFRFDYRNPSINLIKLIESSNYKNVDYCLVDLVGPLCTTIDYLARKIRIRKPDIGDLVVFNNAGAYSLSMSPVMFLSRDIPAEVMVLDDRIELIRERSNIREPLYI